MKYIAQTISYILHPMLMPLYILFFIFNNNTLFAYIPWGVKLYCYLVTVFALLIMPVISLPLFKHFRLIRSYELNDKQERVYPILVAVAFAFLAVGTYRLYKYRKAAIPGVDYFVVHFFSDYFPVEDQYAYDGYRWIMWFSAGLGDELSGGRA